jgi:hypothetical protein
MNWYRQLAMFILLRVPGYVFYPFSLFLMWLSNHVQGQIMNRVEHLGTKALYYLRGLYIMVFFPQPKYALALQVVSWCWGLAWLIVDRQIPRGAIVDESEEDQWQFGQLFVVLIVGVQFISLLETWAGCISAKYC